MSTMTIQMQFVQQVQQMQQMQQQPQVVPQVVPQTPVAAAPPASAPLSPGARIAKLDKLLSDKYITEEEHASKRQKSPMSSEGREVRCTGRFDLSQLCAASTLSLSEEEEKREGEIRGRH